MPALDPETGLTAARLPLEEGWSPLPERLDLERTRTAASGPAGPTEAPGSLLIAGDTSPMGMVQKKRESKLAEKESLRPLA